MIERTLLTIDKLSVPAKIMALVLTFLSPLAALIHVILALLVTDMITSIYYQMKIAFDEKRAGRRRASVWCVIESGRLRKTIEKMFFYVMVIIVFYGFDVYLLKVKPISEDAIGTLSITNLSAVLVALVEMTSIAANISKITGNPIFNTIIGIFTKKVNKKFEIEENESKNNVNT